VADNRVWDSGVRQFLFDEQCNQEKIERVIADEQKSWAP
jgi:hypothetical protein